MVEARSMRRAGYTFIESGFWDESALREISEISCFLASLAVYLKYEKH